MGAFRNLAALQGTIQFNSNLSISELARIFELPFPVAGTVQLAGEAILNGASNYTVDADLTGRNLEYRSKDIQVSNLTVRSRIAADWSGRAADTLPDYGMPKFDGIGANEYVVTSPNGVCDFISTADTPPAATRHRVLDHIGFDVKDHPAFVKELEAEGIKLDEPARTGPTGNTITYITDPWGTRIEIIQRGPLGPVVN